MLAGTILAETAYTGDFNTIIIVRSRDISVWSNIERKHQQEEQLESPCFFIGEKSRRLRDERREIIFSRKQNAFLVWKAKFMARANQKRLIG